MFCKQNKGVDKRSGGQLMWLLSGSFAFFENIQQGEIVVKLESVGGIMVRNENKLRHLFIKGWMLRFIWQMLYFWLFSFVNFDSFI